MGRYSKAPRSVAFTAVSSVFCALMTMMRRSGRSLRMRGTRSRPFSSGITTSVMTRSPSPSSTHATASRRCRWCAPRGRGGPAPGVSTVRMARSSSATRMVAGPLMVSPPPRRSCTGSRTLKTVRPRLAVEFDDAAVVVDDLGDQRQTQAVAVGLVVTNGSNRCGRMSSGMPAPLSSTRDDQRQVRPGVAAAAPPAARRAGRPWSESIVPLARRRSPRPAFFTRLRNTWISRSRLPSTGGSDGS